MDRAAVFVDAGYLFAQGSILIAGTKLRRGDTWLDAQTALAYIKTLSQTLTSLPLLRIYWYDGADSSATAAHAALAFQPDVKVRLGIVNSNGEQKGVDSLIVSDLIDLSRNRAMCDAVVLTGDEDIRIGVQKAQESGVRVHLVGLQPAQQNQSTLLRQEADTLYEISGADVGSFLRRAAPSAAVSPPAPPVVPVGADPLDVAAGHFAGSLSAADRARVAAHTGGVPPDIDRQLLRAATAVIGNRSLSDTDKRELRHRFLDACKSAP